MNIRYDDTHEFTTDQLRDLFLSVDWSSGNYPDRLQIAMRNYETVFTAWDEDRLIGLICVMDDGTMNAYIQYVLVNPEYQGHGIGKELISRVKEHYSDYLRIVLVAYSDKVPFYESCGMERGEGKTPMFITSLTT
ncbi:MAG: GNAT family N-acetyltransferase [Clostridiales bacterium]|nr:GNAT family N-acetyltransferase [Clostridiales bacterium]